MRLYIYIDSIYIDIDRNLYSVYERSATGMSNSILPFEIPEAVAAQAERRWDSSVGMGLLNRLTGADYLSLVALFFAWSSALLLLQGDIHHGVLAMAGAFCFDKLDGYYARSRGVSSSFGRQVDYNRAGAHSFDHLLRD